MTSPRLRAAAAGAAACLLLAACGSATVGGTGTATRLGTGEAAVLAAVKSTSTSSYRFSASVTVAGLSGGGLSALGSLASGGSGDETTMAGEFSAPQHAVEISLSLGAGTSAGAQSIEEIALLASGDVYLRMSLGGPAKWYEVSGSSELGEVESALSQFGGSPQAYLANIAPGIVSVQVAGHPTLGGVATTEYLVTENARELVRKLLSGTLGDDLSQLLTGSSSVPAKDAKTLQQLRTALTDAFDALPATLALQLWVDGAGHPRQVEMSIPIGKLMAAMFTAVVKAIPAISEGITGASGSSGAGLSQALSSIAAEVAGASETLQMGFSGFGGDIRIAVPPASQVQTMPSSLGGSSSGLGGTGTAGTGTGVTGSTSSSSSSASS